MPQTSNEKSSSKSHKIWQAIGVTLLIICGLALVVIASAAIIANSSSNATIAADSVNVASAESGNIGEKIIGDPETASLVIYEYADYGCSHCSEWNEVINSYVEEHPDEIAIVFRSFDLGFTNGTAAAKAATAAQIQGYWAPFKDLLYENQSKWSSATASEAEDLFAQYFTEASNGQGNLEQFRADMASDAVADRLEFEKNLAKEINIKGTPTFRIDGKNIDLTKVEDTIESRLNS